MFKMNWRAIFAFVVLPVLGVLSLQPAALAQARLTRPVKIIVPFTPGTGMDILARLIGEQLRIRSGQSVVVENKPGASGNIGSLAVAQSAPDGTTLMVTANTFVMAAPMYKVTTFDPVRDFSAIGMIAFGQMALAVHPKVQAKDVKDFVMLAKAAPGKIDYASPGNGTPQHLAMESLQLAAGLKLTHIPYKGSAGAVQDLLGGMVGAMILPVHTALPLAADGRIGILGIASTERSTAAPQVATFSEQGVAGFDVDLWYALYGPARMSDDLVAYLNTELNAILAEPAMRETIGKQGLNVRTSTPDALASRTRSDLARWTRVIADANIQAE